MSMILNKIVENNTGSSEYQIFILTKKISKIIKHINISKKDINSRIRLLKIINKRKKNLKYLFRKNKLNYNDIINFLKLKKIF